MAAAAAVALVLALCAVSPAAGGRLLAQDLLPQQQQQQPQQHQRQLAQEAAAQAPRKLPSAIAQLASTRPAAAANAAKPAMQEMLEEHEGREGAKGKQPQNSDLVFWPGVGMMDGELKYWGGKLMTAPMAVHMIFYGDWTKYKGADMALITNFVKSLGDDSVDDMGATAHKWWKVIEDYQDGDGKAVTGDVTLGEVVTTKPGYTRYLNDMQNGAKDDVFGVVAANIASGALPKDPTAIYVVVTGADVAVGNASLDYRAGFCDAYCGYHYHGTLDDGTNLTYALIGNADKCPNACGLKKLTGGPTPNNLHGADSAISILAHELAEAATDPWMDGWYTDGMMFENGDVCAWVFTDEGKYQELKAATNKAPYNIYGLGGIKYMVQTMPDVKKNQCILQADSLAK